MNNEKIFEIKRFPDGRPIQIELTKTQASKILWIPENKISNFRNLCGNHWEFQDSKGYYHLFRLEDENYIELTKNIQAVKVFPWSTNFWHYVDDEGYYHFFEKTDNGDIELTKNIKATDITMHNDEKYWSYADIEGYKHLFMKIDRGWIERKLNPKVINIFFHENGDWEYITTERHHLFLKTDNGYIELGKDIKITLSEHYDHSSYYYDSGDWLFKDKDKEYFYEKKHNRIEIVSDRKYIEI